MEPKAIRYPFKTIEKVKKIVATNLALSAPAVSLGRLALFYKTFDSVLISPKDKEGLIKHLKEINPTIEIKT